ncbi:MAG: ATPase, partial [Acidimicrobiia bacterium]|nr:ATPase [Acidimicrobiia bacterium]
MDWHAETVGAVAAALDTDPQDGLAPGDVAARLERYGPNTIGEESGPSRLRIFLAQFADVLVWVLLVAAFISGVILGEIIDTVVILAIVALNAVIGYTQEVRAEGALAELKEMTAPDAVVIRGGTPSRISADDVVPGDLLRLEAGDRVAADARLIEVAHLEADEASLTGESIPDSKSTEPVPADTSLGDRTSMVYAGTVMTTGRGLAIVTATGTSSEVGRIADLLSIEEPPTPLQVELDRVGKRISVLAGLIAVIIFGLGLLRGLEPETMFLTAVALAVAAIPEVLPAVNTITLARGV